MKQTGVRFSVKLMLFVLAAMPVYLAAKDYLTQDSEKYLFVWAGDQSRKHPDFLAVVNFDPKSNKYGKIITRVQLPGPGSKWNEPHHVGLSQDGNVLGCGGLLSVLKGQKEIFFFDVSNPIAPKLIHSADPPLSSITDEFYALPEGGFLVTMMGGAEGHHPGRVVEFNKDLQIVAEHPKNPPKQGFNPHGISVRPELNLMVTSDFICPTTTLHAVPGDLDLKGSIRIWNFKEKKILRTVQLPNPAGTIDVRLIPQDAKHRAFTAGMTDGQLYLIDTDRGEAKSVFDFNTIANGGWPQLMRITSNGKRLFVSMNMAGKVVMFDISNPNKPKVLKVLDLGENAGPHYIALTKDEKRLVITDYFLNEDEVGKVHAEGDHIIHVARVHDKNLILDPNFNLNFNKVFLEGPARPHGVAFK